MIRFWYGSGSPFAWRVQLVLEEKRVPYEPVLLGFAQGDLRRPRTSRVTGRTGVRRSSPFAPHVE
jgi:glutathione S-transferase